nr:PLP-dependent aminotransferase family protein [Saccharopolyspora sp. HNM0983]
MLGAWHGSDRPSSAALADAVRRLVLDGRLAPGTRLPAERELAGGLDVSRTLVVRALDRLRDTGFAESRRGAGSWARLPGAAGGVQSGGGSWLPGADEQVLDLAQATPAAPPELPAAVERASAALPGQLLGHGYQARGLPVLRARIAEHFARRGLPTGPEQILVTNGAQHAFALALRALVAPGERVLIENPTYPNALEAVSGCHAVPVEVPMSERGWDGELLAATLQQAAPRAAYLIPDFQNPTGVRMDAEAREQLVRALHRSRTTAVVDETLVGIEFGDADPPPPVAAFDERVVTIGSASKLFWGGLRLGWLRGPERFVQRVLAGRAALDLGSPVLEQLVLAELFADAGTIAARRCDQARRRRDALVEALRAYLPQWGFRAPEGGLSLWCDIGEPVSTRLAVVAEQHGVRIAPGPRFGVRGGFEDRVRLPFTAPVPDVGDAVGRLAAADAAVRGRAAADPLTSPIV